MADEREAGLKLYSLGIVLQAKVRGSDTIVVDPIEAFPMDNGAIGIDTKNKKTSLKDQHGVERKSEIKGGSAIKAKWIPFGHSNRESAPDVQPNETVILFAYADTQEFYWTTLFREPQLRRLETVRHMYCNIPDGLTPYDDDTSYWSEISTHDKMVTFHTSNNDGEPFTYDVFFDTGHGVVTLLVDDTENLLQLDSKAVVWLMQNAAGTYLKEDQERFFIYAPDYIHEKSVEIYRVAQDFICDTAPVIYLNSPSVIIGKVDCGQDADSEASYHHRPFVHVSQRLNHARIGNAYEAYTHYDDQDMTSITKSTIQEQTQDKTTQATNSHSVETKAHSVAASDSITENTTTHSVTASQSMTESTKAKTTTADDAITETTKSHTLTTEQLHEESVDAVRYSSNTHLIHAEERLTLRTTPDNWDPNDYTDDRGLHLEGPVWINGQGFQATIAEMKQTIADLKAQLEAEYTKKADFDALEQRVTDLGG